MSTNAFDEFVEKIVEDSSDTHSFNVEESHSKENVVLNMRIIDEDLISPMIGMEDLSPYDFMKRS